MRLFLQKFQEEALNHGDPRDFLALGWRQGACALSVRRRPKPGKTLVHQYRESQILASLKFVKPIASALHQQFPHSNLDDLIQIGALGLIAAIDHDDGRHTRVPAHRSDQAPFCSRHPPADPDPPYYDRGKR
jgi:hypothetical protein